MTLRVTHATLYVKDQNEALRFYTEKLGFEVRADVTMGDFRWLTVGSKDQPDFEFILYPVRADGFFMSEDDAAVIGRLLAAGKLGGPLIKTSDINQTYEEWKAKGVVFERPPTEQPYAIEAIFKDNSGNTFSLHQDK